MYSLANLNAFCFNILPKTKKDVLLKLKKNYPRSFENFIRFCFIVHLLSVETLSVTECDDVDFFADYYKAIYSFCRVYLQFPITAMFVNFIQL